MALFCGCKAPAAPAAAAKTTDGDVAVANLDAQIAELERQIAIGADSEKFGRLLLLLSTRAQILARAGDLEAMLSIGSQAIARWPEDPYARIGRAHALISAHFFKQAEAELERAVALGASRASVDDQWATIYAATGRLELARAAIVRTGIRDSLHLGREAAILAGLGEHARAEELFVRAEATHQETSPFVIAWVLLQHAQFWEHNGDDARARALYEQARARLPQLYAATLGLARVLARSKELASAQSLLRPLLDHENPEAAALLATLTTGEESTAALKRATERYAALLEKLPTAYAEHAANFYLRTADRPDLALPAAQKNLDTHATREAFELALLAALAARDHQAACAIVAQLKNHRDAAAALAPLAATAACESSRPR